MRLLRPLDTYPSPLWGLHKVFLLLQKQRNRGQDGAGLLTYKANAPLGSPYFFHKKIAQPSSPWQLLIQSILEEWEKWQKEGKTAQDFPFVGEGYLAHLRYGTFGGYTLAEAHPVIRQNSWASRSLAIAGNFNLTNAEALFDRLISLGQHPIVRSDTYTILERMGHFLDEFVENLYQEAKTRGLSKKEATEYIRKHFPVTAWLARSARRWDGGYVIAGWIGTGWGFVMRDPLGIRPAYYFASEEVVAVASEAAALQNVFQAPPAQVRELPPAHALIISPEGQWSIEPFAEPAAQPLSCSFERIYFSRGNSPAIYQERKTLGALLAHEIAHILDYDLERVVFTYIPNTSQVAFWGMLQELERLVRERFLASLEGKPITQAELQHLARLRIRAEMLIWKDTQSRTFISAPTVRTEMSRHVYDVVPEIIRPYEDTLVCLDDSIVRGTTLRETLLRTLARLQPARLIIASSAPQIRYPDFYGIDMASLHDLVAFQAAISLLRETGKEEVIHTTYHRCREAYGTPEFSRINFVQAIYAPFTEEQIAARIAQLVRPPELEIPLTIVYQPIQNLERALPHHKGRWYFTGEYPTPGGYEQVNRAFMQFYEGKVQQRAYEKVSS